MFIYLIVNQVTGKYYIGQHKGNNLEKYLRTKLSDAYQNRGGRSHLFASMRKYGKNVWSIHALLSDIQTKVELDQKEKDFISFLKCQDNEYGYNICRGGEGRTDKGWHHSPETRAKLSASNRGKHRERLLSPENQKLRITAWQQALEERNGTFHTPETVNKLKEIRANQDETFRLEKHKEYERLHPERRQRAAATHRGAKHKMSQEGSQAISRAFKEGNERRWAKLSESLIGHKFGRLTVQEDAGRSSNPKKYRLWKCLCECGGWKITTTSLLRGGKTKSCGCLARESRARNGRAKLNALRREASITKIFEH